MEHEKFSLVALEVLATQGEKSSHQWRLAVIKSMSQRKRAVLAEPTAKTTLGKLYFLPLIVVNFLDISLDILAVGARFYPHITKLETEGSVSARWGYAPAGKPRRRYYAITETGTAKLQKLQSN